ncbi:pilus assembly protein PilZ [Pseudomonas capsici]|uniref:Pilus assembly protein PilZ n=1 Tax=Pseudomonas capsici TaxID=2810614 RepID=A0ABT3BTK0_9PSED|nr:pilus assembly protein PilZ [Pseudomonas capsici]MBX8473262.1 pilus assembly protein PilZ [Pseudomonas cichorii]MBX8610555.1 pilus assembly protein PilZ [Pseudomonas cichorii]MCV4263154.1 pilus assembly protein PilZ [Pseudomonas capsici]MCV4266837.1 pilus assembly protein PilZ [Pseudomonas capsici]MCV4277572.1 pilus assembly protein PilZ [Pseudomonas capsici]
MIRLVWASHMLLVMLIGWLAAQCVLQAWHGLAQPATDRAPMAPVAGLLSSHWRAGPVLSNELPLTTLGIEYLGSFKAIPLSATVVVLRFEQRQRTLGRGQKLAPGVSLHDIDELGMVFDNNGKLERLPWPAQRPYFGFKQQG